MSVPASVRLLLDAMNAEDTEDFLGVFHDDAVVDDDGRRFEGLLQIAEWNMRHVIGARARVDVRHGSGSAEGAEVALDLSRHGSTVPRLLTVRLREELISHLVLRPEEGG
ncbi:hypothetical protein NUM3379_28200 [Kineococcus sp. NUM-3379]